jgi:hypothetical protein
VLEDSDIIDIPAVLALFGSKNEFLRMHSFSMLDARLMNDQPA